MGEALADAAIRAYAAEGDPYRIRHRVQITSFGGSGTTALTKSFLEAGLVLPPGPAQWPHKHTRRPPTAAAVPEGFRVVYPVGDPRDAVVSIFRRTYQWGHWRALHDGPEDRDPPASLESLESFVAAGVDEFALADHLDTWLDHPPGYPVMVLRFDRIDEAWETLADFVGLPDDHPRLVHLARASDWRAAPPTVREGLDALYGPLAARIAGFPPVQVV